MQRSYTERARADLRTASIGSGRATVRGRRRALAGSMVLQAHQPGHLQQAANRQPGRRAPARTREWTRGPTLKPGCPGANAVPVQEMGQQITIAQPLPLAVPVEDDVPILIDRSIFRYPACILLRGTV